MDIEETNRRVTQNRIKYADELAALRDELMALENKPFHTSISDQQRQIEGKISEVLHRE